MGFYDKYPYTDFHELNLDWLLAEMKALEEKLDNTVSEITAEVTQTVERYVDEQLADLTDEFDRIKVEFANVQRNVNTLNDAFESFTSYVDDQITFIKSYIDAQVNSVNNRTDVLIASNNQLLLQEMQTYLNQIKVVNYFTGDLTTIQDMFNYLSELHLTQAIDYDTMALRAKTYTWLAAQNKTYTDLAMNGNVWYV